MPLILDDDQAMLRESARGVVSAFSSIAAVRLMRDGGDRRGYGPELWRAITEFGALAVMAPEVNGGMGLGHVEAGIVAAELGRNAAPTPFVATAVGATIAMRSAAEDVAAGWLEKIVAGETIAALALDECARHRPGYVALRAEPCEGGFRLSGRKCAVAFGHVADLVIVSGRTTGENDADSGMTMFAIAGDADFDRGEPRSLVDSSVVADLSFDATFVPAAAMIGGFESGSDTLGRILASVRAVQASELLAVGEAAEALTIDYISTRKQFGVHIGSFQALQHRAAQLHGELQLASSTVLRAQQALDAGEPTSPMLASVAKAIAAQAATRAVQEGVQMHGGVGMTDEYDIGLLMKRARVLSETWGDFSFHVDRVARMNGY